MGDIFCGRIVLLFLGGIYWGGLLFCFVSFFVLCDLIFFFFLDGMFGGGCFLFLFYFGPCWFLGRIFEDCFCFVLFLFCFLFCFLFSGGFCFCFFFFRGLFCFCEFLQGFFLLILLYFILFIYSFIASLMPSWKGIEKKIFFTCVITTWRKWFAYCKTMFEQINY